MGSKGSKQSTSTSAPPKYIANAIAGVLDQAKKVSQLPLTQYTGPQLAGFSPLQEQGFDAIGNAGNSWQTYFNNAQDLVGEGTQDTWSQVPEFNSENLQKYQNPYLDSVLNNTISKMRATDNQAQQDLTGDAIMAGAWGGSGASDAKMNLARQQGESRNSTIADLNNTGFNTAVTNFMGDRNAQLAALQNTANTKLQGASQMTDMGTSNLSNILNYVNGLSTVGGTQQAQEQKGMDIAKGIFDTQQAYPYQQTQYLANIISAMSGGAGGTSTSTQPGQNNTMSNLIGLGSIAAAIPWSDERLKENIKKVGKLDNGLSVYKYNMKGENKTQIGVMAQDVEKKNPDAVMDIGGLKAVDYDMATRKQKQNGGGIKAYARGGMINPSDFTFQSATLNAPDAPKIQEDNSDQDAMGMMMALAGLGGKISDYRPANGVDNIKAISDSTGLNKFLPKAQQTSTNNLYKTLSSLQNSTIQKPSIGSSIKSIFGFADGGEVAAPIMHEDTSYVPMTKGIKAYSFNPQAIAAMGRQVSTPLDVAKTATAAQPVAAKNNGKYYVSSDGRMFDVTSPSFTTYLNNEIKGSQRRAMGGLTGDALYNFLGMKPLSYADGGMVDGRMGYAMGGSTEYDAMLAALAGDDAGIIPGITSPSGNPGLQSASLSAPDAPQVNDSAGQLDMNMISNLIAKNGGMSDINDLVSVNDSAPNAPKSIDAPKPTGSFLPETEDKPPVYANRIDEMLDTPWRAALLNAGATMLSTNDVGKGIAAGVTGYASIKKTKADAKKAASDLAAKAEQQKFDNDIAKERLDIMRAGVNNRGSGGSGSGRAPIDVSSKDMDSIEEAALMMIPGVMQFDDKGKAFASEEALGLIADKRLAARDVASQVYQQTRNGDQAAKAYLQALGVDPSSQEFAPATEEENNWFSADKPAQDAGFKPSSKKALADAKEALKNGAPRDKVIQRLKDNGISTEGL